MICRIDLYPRLLTPLLAYIEHGLQLLWVSRHEGRVIDVEEATYPYWCGGAMRSSGIGETRAELDNQVCHIDPEEAGRELGALGEATQNFDTIMRTSDSQCHNQRADQGVCAGRRMGMPWCSQ